MANDVEISKFMSLVLRHAPTEAGLSLDEQGWAEFSQLCQALRQRFGVDQAEIRRIVETNPKRRFVLRGDRIRAAQGHSLSVDLGMSPVSPPHDLYHGTKREFIAQILEEGLRKGKRQHVHLSPDPETARIVARRRPGDDAILRVDAAVMAADGFEFFLSENGVWLTDTVPSKYLTPISEPAPT